MAGLLAKMNSHTSDTVDYNLITCLQASWKSASPLSAPAKSRSWLSRRPKLSRSWLPGMSLGRCVNLHTLKPSIKITCTDSASCDVESSLCLLLGHYAHVNAYTRTHPHPRTRPADNKPSWRSASASSEPRCSGQSASKKPSRWWVEIYRDRDRQTEREIQDSLLFS